MATKTYIVAENWGKGFIEHSESAKLLLLDFLVMFGKYLQITKMQIFGLQKF